MPPKSTPPSEPARLVRLVCWSDEIAKQRATQIKAHGYQVDASSLRGSSAYVSRFRSLNPDAIVIDLDRLPSHGREVALALRASKSTRHFPIVFTGGVDDKVQKLRAELPDAVFTTWEKVGLALKRAIANPISNPVRSVPHMERWNKSSLTQKLGMGTAIKVALIGDHTRELEEILGELPEGVTLSERIAADTKLILYPVHTLRELDVSLDHASRHLPETASFWIIHPKGGPGIERDFNQNDVRELALARGFVDYKVCSVDSRLSGLKFTHKKH